MNFFKWMQFSFIAILLGTFSMNTAFCRDDESAIEVDGAISLSPESDLDLDQLITEAESQPLPLEVSAAINRSAKVDEDGEGKDEGDLPCAQQYLKRARTINNITAGTLGTASIIFGAATYGASSFFGGAVFFKGLGEVLGTGTHYGLKALGWKKAGARPFFMYFTAIGYFQIADVLTLAEDLSSKHVTVVDESFNFRMKKDEWKSCRKEAHDGGLSWNQILEQEESIETGKIDNGYTTCLKTADIYDYFSTGAYRIMKGDKILRNASELIAKAMFDLPTEFMLKPGEKLSARQIIEKVSEKNEKGEYCAGDSLMTRKEFVRATLGQQPKERITTKILKPFIKLFTKKEKKTESQ